MAITTHWGSPPQDLLNGLMPGTVHVWRAPLDDSPGRASRYRSYLSADELIRADRFRTPHPQYQFVVTRGILRMLLSRYVGIPPAQLHFETQAQGKLSGYFLHDFETLSAYVLFRYNPLLDRWLSPHIGDPPHKIC